MSDQEKITKVKEIVTEWALDDSSSATETLIAIMETLEFDPYEEKKCAA